MVESKKKGLSQIAFSSNRIIESVISELISPHLILTSCVGCKEENAMDGENSFFFLFFFPPRNERNFKLGIIKLAEIEEETRNIFASLNEAARIWTPATFGHAATALFPPPLSVSLDLVVTPPSSKWKGRVRHYSPRLQFRRCGTGGRMYSAQLIVK